MIPALPFPTVLASSFMGLVERFVQWCTAHEGFIDAISMALYALFTVVLVVQGRRANRDTRRAVEEAKAAREAEYRPLVTFDLSFDYNRGLVFAHIKNQGRLPAHNIRFAFSESLLLLQRKPGDRYEDEQRALSEMRWLKNLNSLMPGRHLSSFLGSWGPFYDLNKERRLVGEISYTDASGRHRYQEPITIEIDDYVDITQIREHDLSDLIRKLEDINRSIQQAARR